MGQTNQHYPVCSSGTLVNRCEIADQWENEVGFIGRFCIQSVVILKMMLTFSKYLIDYGIFALYVTNMS
jgi:hypothetical protein